MGSLKERGKGLINFLALNRAKAREKRPGDEVVNRGAY